MEVDHSSVSKLELDARREIPFVFDLRVRFLFGWFLFPRFGLGEVLSFPGIAFPEDREDVGPFLLRLLILKGFRPLRSGGFARRPSFSFVVGVFSPLSCFRVLWWSHLVRGY